MLFDAHAAQHGWGSLHRQYPTVDITVDKLACGGEVRRVLRSRLLPLYAERFGTQYGPAASLDFRDLFVAQYDAEAPGGQVGLEGHVDASMLSMVLQLSAAASFEGGGTRFEHGRRGGLVCRPEQGGAVLFLGKIFHAAEPITRGRRYVLVALIDRTEGVAAHRASM